MNRIAPSGSIERDLMEAAANLAEARVRYAQAFLLAKARKGTSDGMAHEMAVEQTRDEITVLGAELEIARERYRKT